MKQKKNRISFAENVEPDFISRIAIRFSEFRLTTFSNIKTLFYSRVFWTGSATGISDL